jgi:DNA-binding transcriptional MerR regulator
MPVPAIKYHLREGLLPAGERTSPNQVRYDGRHVHRLRLIHALLEVGELSVADACDVLADVADLLEPYADAAERLAVPEVEWVARGKDPDSLAERAVVGTVFGDAMVPPCAGSPRPRSRPAVRRRRGRSGSLSGRLASRAVRAARPARSRTSRPW